MDLKIDKKCMGSGAGFISPKSMLGSVKFPAIRLAIPNSYAFAFVNTFDLIFL
jgi:hypothetical protein